MNKNLQMYFYNKLLQLNPSASKTKVGRSHLMHEAVYITKCVENKMRYYLQKHDLILARNVMISFLNNNIMNYK